MWLGATSGQRATRGRPAWEGVGPLPRPGSHRLAWGRPALLALPLLEHPHPTFTFKTPGTPSAVPSRGLRLPQGTWVRAFRSLCAAGVRSVALRRDWVGGLARLSGALAF